MRYGFSSVIALGIAAMFAVPALADTIIYNNLTPNNSIGIASRPGVSGQFEIETGDDFVLGAETIVDSASFVGLIVPGATGTPVISDVVVEMYQVFPFDSNTNRIPNVPTRANSPSDDAFASRDSGAANELTFSSTTLSANFTALNSVQPGGIHGGPAPLPPTGGNGPINGQEVELNVTFTTPFDLPANHYFFVPQVSLTNGGEFFWLSASRPISGTGINGFATTPFPAGVTDLQVWTRDAMLDPDWLRVGTDIVGGNPAPTFNAAFALIGTPVPEPSSVVLTATGLLVLIGARRRRSVL